VSMPEHPVPGGPGGETWRSRRWKRDPRLVGQARRELRTNLDAWGLAKLTDRAELVLSELFTNSLVHAVVPYDRHIGTRYFPTSDGGVLIEVHDADENRPVVRDISDDAESGRGLELVEALTGGCWGVTGREGVGKRVWAIVSDGGCTHGCGAELTASARRPS